METSIGDIRTQNKSVMDMGKLANCELKPLTAEEARIQAHFGQGETHRASRAADAGHQQMANRLFKLSLPVRIGCIVAAIVIAVLCIPFAAVLIVAPAALLVVVSLVVGLLACGIFGRDVIDEYDVDFNSTT